MMLLLPEVQDLLKCVLLVLSQSLATLYYDEPCLSAWWRL
jgi:hypothetical protein